MPDYRFGTSQLILATLAEDGSVSQEVLPEEPDGIIRDLDLSFDAKMLVFAAAQPKKTTTTSGR